MPMWPAIHNNAHCRRIHLPMYSTLYNINVNNKYLSLYEVTTSTDVGQQLPHLADRSAVVWWEYKAKKALTNCTNCHNAIMSSLTIDFSVRPSFTTPVSTKQFVLIHQTPHQLKSMLQHVMHRLSTETTKLLLSATTHVSSTFKLLFQRYFMLEKGNHLGRLHFWLSKSYFTNTGKPQ